MKILLCAVLLMALCLVLPESAQEQNANLPDDDITVSIPVPFDGMPESGIYPDEKMLLQTGECCDPEMLLPVETPIDPAFLIERAYN